MPSLNAHTEGLFALECVVCAYMCNIDVMISLKTTEAGCS